MKVTVDSPITFSTLLSSLKSCITLKDLSGGRKAHADAINVGLDSNIYVATNLINMYAKCGSLVDAYRVFQRMPHRNVVTWTALMLGYSDNGEEKLVLELFSRMQADGCLPNHRTFVVVLKSCANLAKREVLSEVDGRPVKVRSLEKGMCVHARAATAACSDIFVLNTLVDMYASCGCMEDAHRVFCMIPVRDTVSWNALILGYAVNGEELLALEFLSCMRAEGSCVPNGRTFLAALRACTGLAEKEEKQDLNKQAVKLLSLERAMSVQALAERLNCGTELILQNLLVDLYSKCGSLVDSKHLFDKIPQRDLITWNSLILGYADNGDCAQAWEVFSNMELKPDARTCVTALKACGNMQATDVVKSIHAGICRNGFEEGSSNVITNSLIDVYGKCGDVVAAQLVFDGCTAPMDTVSWNSLIAGYSRKGDTDNVFSLFQVMVENGLQASGITFIHLLSACGHGGEVSKGKECFRVMQGKYGIEATADHYICMVDMLGRVHELDVVVEMVKKMPGAAARDWILLWKAVLSSCEKWRNLELG